MDLTPRDYIRMAVLAGVYIIAAKIGLSIYAVHGFATLVWPPTGIALAALILYGRNLWPGVFVGALLANLIAGAPFLVAIGIAVGNTLEAATAAYVLMRHIKLDLLFARLQDAMGFLAVSLTTALISASIGTLSLLIGGVITSATFSETWVAWWMGNILGAFIFGAFLLRWLSRPFFRRTPPEVLEGFAAFGLLALVSIVLFWTQFSVMGSFPLVYLVIIPLVWIALRTGPRGMTLGILILSLVGTSAAVFHQGYFSTGSTAQTLFLFQVFMAFLVLIFFPFVSIVEDRKNARGILEENVKKLQEALKKISAEDQAKNDFLAILAHELRNPLAPVVSALELLKIKIRELGRHDIEKLVNTAGDHMHTITELLDDLLDIARISQKKFKLQKKSVELQSLVHHSVETVEQFYTSQKHTLSTSLPKDPIWLVADPLRLQQVIVNILYNAAKYTKPGGQIQLTVVSDRSRGIRISVRDNGVGIPRDMLTRIFDAFVQLDDKARVGTGLGIGLSLTKRLVELHNGRVWAESAGLNQGSEFIVVLPPPSVVQQSIPEERKKPLRSRFSLSKNKAKHTYRILVVDDNEPAAKGLKTLLEHRGHSVSVAYDGHAALSRMRTYKPEVALFDIGLPGMDGYTLAREVRKTYGSESPLLVALTGYGQMEDRIKGQEAGFNYHLVKPVGIADIESVLAKKR